MRRLNGRLTLIGTTEAAGGCSRKRGRPYSEQVGAHV